MPMQFPLILAILIQLLPPPCFACVQAGMESAGACVVAVEEIEGCGGCCGAMAAEVVKDDLTSCTKCWECRDSNDDGRQPLAPGGQLAEGVALAWVVGAPIILVGLADGANRLVSLGGGVTDKMVVSASARRAALCCWIT